MRNTTLIFLFKLVLLAFLLLLSCYLSINKLPVIVNKNYPFIIALFTIITLIFHLLLNKASAKKFSSFVNGFMAFTMLKLLFYLVILLIGVFADRPNAKSFIITYFLSYLFFTAFEVIETITRQSKTKKNN